MKFLLKIVQGPNAGAEIALVEGVRVTLGSADSCDIVLADPTLPAEACAIEASADAVVLTPTDAEPETLAPLQVHSFGSTALAVGPADAPWGPLNWAAPAAPSEGSGDAPLSSSDPAAPENAPLREGGGGEAAGGSTPPPPAPASAGGSGVSPGRLVRRIGCLVILLLLLLLAGWLFLRYRSTSASPDEPAPSEPVEAPVPATPDGVTLFETNGVLHARGDFATRAERLAATAALYEAHPGIKLDLADQETLLSSTTDLLLAATEGTLTVADITNRVAVLAGHASDPAVLKATLDALRADVPRLSGFDTAAVVLDSPLATPSGGSGASPDPLARPSQARRRQRPLPPLCGILLQPYPCLVLQNGQRLAVGAELAGYKIVEITPDRIKVRNAEEEELEWTP